MYVIRGLQNGLNLNVVLCVCSTSARIHIMCTNRNLTNNNPYTYKIHSTYLKTTIKVCNQDITKLITMSCDLELSKEKKQKERVYIVTLQWVHDLNARVGILIFVDDPN